MEKPVRLVSIDQFGGFAIGLTYTGSLRRRVARSGLDRAIEHFVRRWQWVFSL